MPGRSVTRGLPVQTKPLDLEIKDANIIFDSIWAELEEEFGSDKIYFPKETIWLNGAPGGGKGTQTPYIMEVRDLTAPPIFVSDLLNSSDATRLKDAGLMVGDREVTGLVLRRLLEPAYKNGAIVDGYPRTMVQVQCLKLLYSKIMQLHREHIDTPKADLYQNTTFHIIVLFLDEAESVQRQLHRGRECMEHNEQVRTSGIGEIEEARKTDLSESAARNRYRTFKEITHESLKLLREVFHYHYIDAKGTIEEVQDRVINELRYQSSLELDGNTYRQLHSIPIASNIAVHGRQELIRRLEDYERNHSNLFQEVLTQIQEEFLPVIRMHALSGIAVICSQAPIFSDRLALAMLLDIFSERGFRPLVDVTCQEVPVSIDPETNRIINETRETFRFQINFPGSDIRRGR